MDRAWFQIVLFWFQIGVLFETGTEVIAYIIFLSMHQSGFLPREPVPNGEPPPAGKPTRLPQGEPRGGRDWGTPPRWAVCPALEDTQQEPEAELARYRVGLTGGLFWTGFGFRVVFWVSD